MVMSQQFETLLERGLDPALDPILWANAGGNASLALTATQRSVSQRLADILLPRPMCVAVQIGRDFNVIPSYNSAVTMFADVQWQSGRGAQAARVDVGPGTTFTLAAAQSVSVTVTMSATGADLVTATLQCTMAPANAQNPLPAYLTDRFDNLIAQATSASTRVPAFARRAYVLTGSDRMSGQVEIQYQTLLGGAFQIADCHSGDLVPPQATHYVVVNPTLAPNNIDLVTCFVMFELVL